MDNLQTSLLEWLIANKKLPRKKAEEIARKTTESGLALDQVLVGTNSVDRTTYLEALSAVTGAPPVDLADAKISASVAQIIPRNMAERFNLLCLKKEGNAILVAMLDPKDSFALEYVKMRTGFEVHPHCAYSVDLAQALEKAYAMTVTFIGRDTPLRSDAERAGHTPGESGSAPAPEHKSKFVVATAQKSPRENILARDTLQGKKPAEAKAIRLEGYKTASLARDGADAEVHALRALLDIGDDLASTLTTELLVRKILQNAMDLTDSEGASLILITDEGNQLFFKESLGPRSEDVKRLRLPLDEHSLVGYSVQNRVTLRVNDVNRDPRHSKLVDQETDFRTRSMLCCPVFWRGTPKGALTAVNKCDNKAFSDADQEYMEILASMAAVALNNAEIMDRLTNFYTETVGILIDVLEVHDNVSRDHLVAVARFATTMGQHLNLSGMEIERLCYAGLLHDIGKIRCEDPNSPEHTVLGAAMLERVRLFRDLLPLIRYHHESFDGTGFPDGLEKDQIPYLARILAIAEAYVEGLSEVGPDGREEFLRSIRYQFGTHFDPDLRPAFEYALVNAG